MPRTVVFALTISLLCHVRAWSLFAQTVTPTPPLTPTPTPPLWWTMAEGDLPIWLSLLIGLIIFLAGTFARPLLEDLANALQRWVGSWGKAGNFRKRYLDWVVAQNRFDRILSPNQVAARTRDQRKKIELEDLYTPLSLGVEREMPEKEWRSAELQPKWLEPLIKRLLTLWRRVRPPQKPSAGAIGDLIDAHPLLVILGDPGSGKTTLLRYLAISCARTLRRKRGEGDDRRLVWRRFGWRKALFPIIIPLQALADVGDWSVEERLLDKMARTLEPELFSQYPTGFFARRLQKGYCLVLFDGFDELGSSQARNRMAELIAGLTTQYAHLTNRFVVSSRIVGYEEQLDAYGFTERIIGDLAEEAVQTLVQRRYRAMALIEGWERTNQSQADLIAENEKLAQDLLANLARNAGLRRLTINPLLLSLIVLVHSVKIELPDERHQLYRDCVEILTERWQEFRRAGTRLEKTPKPNDLKLEHKLVLLREIALTMQQEQQTESSQALIRRETVEAIIAARLPNFIADQLPEEAEKRSQLCERRAAALLDDIRENSQILMEKGFDAADKRLIGFSHLTFQEYLAAEAVREQTAQLPLLLANLFNPTWREVLLLYVGMVDAGSVIDACLTDTRQPPLTRYLLAGRCLAEKVNINVHLREQVLTGLRSYFCPPSATPWATTADLIARIGGEKRYDWLITNLCQQMTPPEQQRFAQAPTQATSFYSAMQALLLRLLLAAEETTVRYQCGCTLSAIGDPRDLDEWVTIPAGEFIMGSEEYNSEKPVHRMHLAPYKIGKYPVTNTQYQRFVEATGHRSPDHWRGGKPAPWQATHPVIYVSWDDAQAYCRWLSEELGATVRLPTEAEWARAARGTDGRKWPWGNAFDSNCANTYHDRGDWRTTPVGMYPLGASPEGVLDMAGNVWEWTA